MSNVGAIRHSWDLHGPVIGRLFTMYLNPLSADLMEYVTLAGTSPGLRAIKHTTSYRGQTLIY